MLKKIIGLFVFILSFSLVNAQVVLKRGMAINKSIKIENANYELDGYESVTQSAITIEGNNVIVDFNNAVINGNIKKSTPNQFYGVAIIIKNAKNITIKNLVVKGYKLAVLARNVQGLKIENCDFSYNYRQHLNSTQEKEDLSDWLSHHHNENDEWLRYGAAIYLRGCNNFTIANCKVTGGQNALMMMECNNGIVYNNDFSFNSGLGIGMYKSSGNKIVYNKLDFNVRGYSHGVYNRGQDSAGILVYEQSNNNLFYSNSVTHGGDGFFLWAGQTTMDTGKGGCNGNRIINNDFSYAPTNGIEVTFSSNQIIRNRIFECDHGIWGGYSYNTTISSNQFRNNRIAIAIEHGQHNRIDNNIFYRDGEAIRLWSRKEQPSDWGYAKYHDTRSVGYTIALNSFNQNPLVYNIIGTDSLRIFNNRYSTVGRISKMDSTVTNVDSSGTELNDMVINYPTVKNPINPFKGNAKFAGRKNIMITEWGPYDFRYPIIWNTNPTDTSGTMRFDVLGPKGNWKLVSVKGVELDKMIADTFPNKFSSRELPAKRTDIEIIAEYSGPAFMDAFGNKISANAPYRFAFTKFFQPIDFTVKFYTFDSTNNPIKKNSIAALIKGEPFTTERVNKLDYAWWGGIKSNDKQYTQFVTIAEGIADLQAGNYELGVTWDDAVRIYLDDKLIVDEWNPSKYLFDESPNKKVPVTVSEGLHKFKVEHVELGGFATLSLKVNKVQ
ncbi:MAG TPA: right-handed parallel beta-helix repeat-containing protein [Flavisolibacter sp.]|jgi:parallel beta-helix repeat protein|nr:right-handed parallel beta-helix repeat-containing protein [Flavisolibacter sp.]